MSQQAWVGVDADGTLFEYDGWKGPTHLGKPIPPMIEQVKEWLRQGIVVKIFTARIAHDTDGSIQKVIEDACQEHIGQVLPVTATKDYGCVAIFDDRAFNVRFNTGKISDDFLGLPEWLPVAK